MSTNVKNVKDTNETENGYIKVFNQAAYVAKCFIGYTIDGIKEEFESPYFPVLQSYKFDIPQHATNITFLAVFTFDFSDWGVIFDKQYNTPPQVCFALYGTLFNPSYEEIKCPLGSTGGGNVGTTPNTTEGMPPIITPSSCTPCCYNPYCKPCYKPCCKPCCCNPCCKPCCKPCCCDPCCKPCCKPCCCDPCCKPCCKPCCNKCSNNDQNKQDDIVYPANYYDNTDSKFSSSNIYYDYYNY